MPRREDIHSILIIGSGPIIIGQASEFDYSGTQALKALKEEHYKVILVNSNPATIMSDPEFADRTYLEPLTVEYLEKIIQKENPHALLATLGGQKALNLSLELDDAGILDKHRIQLIGVTTDSIRKAEDRMLFRRSMEKIGLEVPESGYASSLKEAVDIVKKIKFPVVIRPSFTLGGTGGYIIKNWEDFYKFVPLGLAISPVSRVLIEKSIIGWKEFELEVMRDKKDNVVIVCPIENFDPMGVHTGDSITVAPAQTLTDKEYQTLRSASLKIIRALGVEGGCNIQFALTPSPVVAEKWAPDQLNVKTSQYYVIEVNPRVSRSSALASKATGYPIARVAAKIAVGKKLDEIPNQVTGKTMAAFEPALDYCVVKIPRWPFDKFALGDRHIGSQMKATGEVMAIDRCFEAALQKAVRSLEFGKKSLLWEDKDWDENIDSYPLYPNDVRLWAIMAALRRGASCEQLAHRTGIDIATFSFTTAVSSINVESGNFSSASSILTFTPHFLNALI